MAADGLLGQDLGDLIQDACSSHGLNVQLNAIVNDSSATLLSKAYLDTTTRFSLILGTGVNAAVHLPVHVFSSSKFGERPEEWHEKAKHVIETPTWRHLCLTKGHRTQAKPRGTTYISRRSCPLARPKPGSSFAAEDNHLQQWPCRHQTVPAEAISPRRWPTTR